MPNFAEQELQAIASRLNMEEAALLGPGQQFSQEDINAVDTGNYNVQVLMEALHRRGMTLERCTTPEAITRAFAHDSALLLHARNHWLAYRRYSGAWHDLNSVLKRPARVADGTIKKHIAGTNAPFETIWVLRQINAEGMTEQYVHGGGRIDENSAMDLAAAVGTATLEATMHFAGEGGSSSGASGDAEQYTDAIIGSEYTSAISHPTIISPPHSYPSSTSSAANAHSVDLAQGFGLTNHRSSSSIDVHHPPPQSS